MTELAAAALLCGEEGEQLKNLFFAGCASVFGDFKGLGVLNAAGFRPVEFLHCVSPLGLDAADGDGPRREPGLACNGILRNLIKLANGPRKPLVELRDVCVEHGDLFLVHVVNGNHNVGPEWLRPREPVTVIEEHGISTQGRRVGHDIRHYDHVGRILHEHSGIAMIGMIVVGTGPDHNVRLPLADLADDLLADV